MKKITILLLFLLSSISIHATNWLASFEYAKKISISTHRLILVDFTAYWCAPCQKMEKETWKNQEIQQIMTSYVPLKIDLDLATEIKRKYAVNAIPLILIIDANEEILYKQLGYQDKDSVKKVLKKFALNTSFLSKETASFYKHKSYVTAIRLAQKYIDYSLYLKKEVSGEFLALADNYLQISEKMLDKDQSNYEMMKEKIELMELNVDLFSQKFKRVDRKLGKYTYDKLADSNKSLFDFLNYCVSFQKQEKGALNWKQKLVSDGNSEIYLKKSEIFLKN